MSHNFLFLLQKVTSKYSIWTKKIAQQLYYFLKIILSARVELCDGNKIDARTIITENKLKKLKSSDNLYPLSNIKLHVGSTVAPTPRLRTNFMLRTRFLQPSGTYRTITASIIGICPKTKQTANVIKNNSL